jgi:hypothetical protein
MQRKFAQKYSSKIVSLLVSIVVLLSFFGDIPKARATFPVISDVASGSVTSVSAIITWTTDIASNSLVDYGLTTAYGYTSGDAINLVTDHSIEITGLVPGTPYRFRVRSADSTGDESSDDNSGFGFTFTTVASPVISNVHLADLGNNYVTIDWQTDVAAYPYVAYGATDNYGKLVGDEETAVTSHSISLAGLTLGNLYHYKPRVKDIYGNFTYYGSDNVFTVGSPHLQSFTSSTSDETYGPASAINITANYSENLATGSTITVVLNTGASVTLDTITDSTKLTGTYTVGATGSGQNTNDLTVSSVTSQNSCDSNSYCNTSTTLPTNNLAASADLAIDTTAPDFSAVLPVASSSINSVTTTSDISYTLSETIENGTIMITQTGGSGDGNSPHTCTLTSAALSSGAHNNFDTTACSGGAITLVDGAIYTFTFDGEDAPGNAASTITRTSVTFDISSPILQSFTSTTTDGTYGPTANINITANYSENLASGSTATVVLDTGASVTLDTITDNTKLTGSYTVGATGSGQNTSDLLVSSLTSQNSCDGAGNCQIGTDVPGTNINAGSELVIDTIAPTAPTSVLFVTDPINSTNTTSTTLRIIGEINSTIYYSIDDTDGGTSAVTGNIAMEGDGSTDVTNINLSGLTDGTLTGVAYLRDAAGNNSGNTQDTVTKDTTNPTFTIQYYSDAELTNSLGDNPHLKAGIYYLKIISGETLNATPTISFDAQGSANDINDATTSFVSGTDYTYTRTIASDVAADGTALETITITGTDAFGNTANAIAPSDAGTKAAYTDTIKPTVSGSVLPVNAKAGSVTVDLTFDENANQLIAPTVVLRKQDSSTLPVTGSFTGPTTWSGTATVAPSDANGTTTLEVSFAADLAGNVMNANNNVTTFTIDTTNPILIINSGVDVGPTKNDTINITTSDTGSGVTSQFHGFSSDATCDTDDTIDTAFVSGSDFVISGDHTDYLCSRAIDNAGNIGYQLVGQLNVDNSVPTITSVSSMVSDERYNANDVIDINVVFSEAVTSAEVLITLETGTTDRTCTFSISDSDTGSCNYIVQAGDISEDLDTKSISGTINDQAGNTMVDFTPDTNLADNKDLIIDTTSPIVNIISPLNGNHVNGDVEIFFSDDDTTDPQCSLDNTNWVTCSSGVTTLADLTDWVALSDGLFTLYLRDTDLAGNIGTDNETGIIKDTDAPRIQTVSSNHDNGRFNVGEIIDIDITFSRNVTSTENVDLYLETGSNDRFCTFSVTDSNIASCDYTVQPTDMSDDLAIKFITPVVGNITDQVGNEMTNFTPITNLDENKDIIIDTLGATITNVTSGHDNGVFGIDEEINIGVTFSEIVTSDGFVTITLDTGGSCTFTLTNSTDGSCNYVVDEGENSTDLNVSAISGTINDQIGNSMTNFVPATNLSANKEIVIDTTLAGNPTITNITSSKDDGAYKAGEIIPIELTFSEAITTNGDVTVTLETGATDRTCTFNASNSTTASCNYVVEAGDISSDLEVSLVSGVIADQASNPMIDFTPLANLAYNKNIVIDTTNPDAPVVTLLDPINDANKNSATITGTGEANTSVNYSIDDVNGNTSAKTGSGSVDGSGNINITNINLTGLDGGTLTATVYLTDNAGNNSTNATDTATSNIILPTITNITSSKDDGAYKAGEIIPIELTFSEAITTNGDVTVTLETGATDRTCTFNASNSTTASCNYVVEAGDISSDLEVSLVSGVIADQASNPMIDFTPLANLAYNKNIVIDTTNPDAPVVTLLDPINDANKNSATITGTGEANTSVNYSIDDVNGNTSAKTGSGSVDGSGNINITNINLTGLDGGTLTATVYLTDIAGNSGTVGTDDATSSVALPTITSISSDKDNRSYSVGTVIDIDFTFSESVTSNGNVTVTLETGTNDRSCTFQVTDSDTASCNYVVQANDASLDLDVLSVSGTILDGTSNPMADFIPLTNLAANKDIIIDTTILSLVSFTSATIDGSYGPLSTINITATYSEALTVGSNISLSLSSGATIVLDTIVNNDTLSGTYTVGTAGSGENTNDLSVSEITEHNSCDLALNCISGTTLPGINIADGSNILIDALSPIFSEVMPLNSSNIDSVTSASDISYTLSESLASGSIVITRTAWELDPNSPHTCTLSGAHLASGQHENFDTANCVEGAITLVTGAVYTFDFNGEDAFGNHATEVSKTGISFGLDNIPPVISDVLVTNITSSSATITWDTDESSNSLVDYGTSTAYGETKGDANADTTTHSVEISDLLPGTDYLLRVRSMDASDNTALDDNSGAGYAFATLDMPTISNIDVTALTSDNATINWDTSANVYGYVEYGVTTSYGKVIGDEDTLKNDHTIDLPGLFAETTYHFRIRIKDTYGNYSVSGDETFETLVNADDNDPPVITNVAVSSITSARATFTWTTDEPASSFVEYGKTTSYGEKYGNDILATDHSITLPASLDGETLYHFRVASSDSARNESVSSDETFTTLTGSSDSDPASGGSSSNISGIKISDITSSTAMVQWKTNQVCNGIVRYGLDKEYGYSTAEDTTIGSLDKFEKNHAVLLTNLLSNTKYNYQVISYDTVGNISVSGNKTFSTSDLSSISKVTIESVTLTSAVILWETGEPTNSELEYGLSTNYGQVQKNSKLSNFHRVELKNLANDQTYHFRIKGKIENSGLISSDDYVFATYPKPEVQKYELKEVTDYEATISWNTNIPTESSVEYLNINNPEDKGSQGFPEASSTHELTIIGLEQGSEYEMKIKGVDINKNAFESSPFTVKTQKDITPPVISNINTESSLVNKKENQVQSIIFWKTDEPATSQVFFDIGMNRAEGYGQSSKEDTNLTTNHLVVLPDLKPGLVYRFKVASKDKNENLQESDTYSLLTPRRDQSVIQLIIANFEQTFGWMKNIKLNK